MIIFFIVSYDTQRELVRMRDTITVRNKNEILLLHSWIYWIL